MQVPGSGFFKATSLHDEWKAMNLNIRQGGITILYSIFVRVGLNTLKI